MRDLDVDFYVLTGHKLYGPTGIGVLYGKAERLAALPPYQGGGEMIGTVSMEAITYADRVAARVVLIDGITLAQLMVIHNIGVQDRETYVIKRVDEDFFEET